MIGIMAKAESGFGERLRKLRKAAGMTYRELAEASGLNVGTVTKIEYGQQEPTWPKIVKLAHALGASPNDFLSDADPPSSQRAPRSGYRAPRRRRRKR